MFIITICDAAFAGGFCVVVLHIIGLICIGADVGVTPKTATDHPSACHKPTCTAMHAFAVVDQRAI